jgi:hypothetical protein
MRRTPQRVVQLLDDLGQTELAGDLVEELNAGRSRAWFWWQVGAAIMPALFGTIRRRPFRTLSAVAVGWTTLVIVEFELRRFLVLIPRAEFLWVTQSPWFSVAWNAAAFLVSGWVVARVHRQHRLALVLVTMLSMALTNAVGIGWYTYYLLTHPLAYGPIFEQGLLLHSVISFLLPVVLVNVAIQLLLPLLVAVGGGFAATGNPAGELDGRDRSRAGGGPGDRLAGSDV